MLKEALVRPPALQPVDIRMLTTSGNLAIMQIAVERIRLSVR